MADGQTARRERRTLLFTSLVRTTRTFIRDGWYVAAWVHEIPKQVLINRTILGEPFLMCRLRDVATNALEDRCCHR
jgi:phenylpropionate dioxygenase-like ring-hydroxylating dioxygenase large terminal subunit